MSTHLAGLIAAPYTPMHADGSLNLAMVERQAESLARNGVIGAFVCGTTGEGSSLSLEERFQVAERWMAVAGGDLKIIVSAAHNALPDGRSLAAHAQKIGACAIAANSPNFFKPAGVKELAAFCAEVASAAPALPFYYYHIPSMTGVAFDMVDFLEEASGRIPTLAGVKFTYENLMDYARCLRLQDGRFDMLFGRDEILLSSLVVGARGAIGSTYNYAAPIYQRVLSAFAAGDLDAARRAQERAVELVAVMVKHGGLPAGKAIMKYIGLDCGPVRLPQRNLSEEQCAALFADLERIGAGEYLSVSAGPV